MIRHKKDGKVYLIPESDEDNKEGLNHYKLQPDEVQVIYGDAITTANMDYDWDGSGKGWKDTDQLQLEFYKGGELAHTMEVPVRSKRQYQFPGADYVLESISTDRNHRAVTMGIGGVVKSVNKAIVSKPLFGRAKMAKVPKRAKPIPENPFQSLRKRIYYSNQLRASIQDLEALHAARAPQNVIDQHIDYIKSLQSQLSMFKQGGKFQEGGKAPWYIAETDMFQAERPEETFAYAYEKWKDEHPWINAGIDTSLAIGSLIGGVNAVALPLMAAKAAADTASSAYTRGEIDILNAVGAVGAGAGTLAKFGKLGSTATAASKLQNAVKTSKVGRQIGNSKLAKDALNVSSKANKTASRMLRPTYNSTPEVKQLSQELLDAQRFLVQQTKKGSYSGIKYAQSRVLEISKKLNTARRTGNRGINAAKYLIRGLDGLTIKPIRQGAKYFSRSNKSYAQNKRFRNAAASNITGAGHAVQTLSLID